MFQALQTKACKAISVMFSEESGEASMSISSELSRKRSGTHMDMAVLMPVKRLRLSQSLHSNNDHVKMTHFVKMTYCQGNKSMLLLHTSSYYNKVMLH